MRNLPEITIVKNANPKISPPEENLEKFKPEMSQHCYDMVLKSQKCHL